MPVVKLGQQIIEIHKELYQSEDGFNTGYQVRNYYFMSAAKSRACLFCGLFALSSYIAIAYITYLGFLLSLCAYVGFIRNIVIKHIGFFTLGVFREDGPSDAQLAESSFTSKVRFVD